MNHLLDYSKGLFLVLHITNKCNLSCSYCYTKKSNIDMSLSIAYAAVNFATSIQKYNLITIVFAGGEPLSVFSNIKKIIKYSQSQGINNFIFVTNGIELDNKKIRFFASNNVAVTVSIDGISNAHNLSRRFVGGGKTWKKVNEVLDLFVDYAKIFNKRMPDCFRARITLTPQTIHLLEKSIHYLTNKPIGSRTLITLMPAMLPMDRWKVLLKNKPLINTLNKQMLNIANLYKEKSEQDTPFYFCINECLPPEKTNFVPQNLDDTSFCGAGIEKIAVSINGKIFPCWIPAANPEQNSQFCMGNVFEGITHPEIIAKFYGQKQNKAFSCLYWNYVENGSPNTPALIYSLLYQSWKKAVLSIKNRRNANN